MQAHDVADLRDELRIDAQLQRWANPLDGLDTPRCWMSRLTLLLLMA
jgi:hypothetical protein